MKQNNTKKVSNQQIQYCIKTISKTWGDIIYEGIDFELYRERQGEEMGLI